jgi:hypothetical protein
MIRFLCTLLASLAIALPLQAQEKMVWDDMYARSMTEKKPVVLFVGCKQRNIPGALACFSRTPRLNVPMGMIGVFVPDSQGFMRLGLLPAESTDDEILTAADRLAGRRKERQPITATPFERKESASKPIPKVEPIADDKPLAAGPWQKVWDKATTFARAKYTQSIFKLNDAPTIWRVNRDRLESHWHQSGGMDGVARHLYKSEIRKYLPAAPVVEQRLIGVLNSFGYYQNEYGWTRKYPNGTAFIDRLSNPKTGKDFEVRVREKKNGEWKSAVAFSDPSERPAGYHGLKQSCSFCHDQAGSGGYGVGLVPGGDTIISDPFPALEM